MTSGKEIGKLAMRDGLTVRVASADAVAVDADAIYCGVHCKAGDRAMM